VSGLLKPRLGTVELDGVRLDQLGTAGVLGKGVAQVPQSQALFPQMTIRENVLLGGYTLRRDRTLLNKRYDRVSELIPIVAERSNDKAGNLSGGQRRMVEIARCMMVDPSVLLLDEPSLGLDPKSLSGVSGLVRDANAAGTTVLLVEQNVRLGLSMATHGVVLEGGRVRLEAPAGELMANPEVAELYLGGHATKDRNDRVAGPLQTDAAPGR
jgi:branched-chain amino acid transport system ATP-binding protein